MTPATRFLARFPRPHDAQSFLNALVAGQWLRVEHDVTLDACIVHGTLHGVPGGFLACLQAFRGRGYVERGAALVVFDDARAIAADTPETAAALVQCASKRGIPVPIIAPHPDARIAVP